MFFKLLKCSELIALSLSFKHLDIIVFGITFKLETKIIMMVLPGGSSIIFKRAFVALIFNKSKLCIRINVFNLPLYEFVNIV